MQKQRNAQVGRTHAYIDALIVYDVVLASPISRNGRMMHRSPDMTKRSYDVSD